jgi:SAM-dependent methyltransferase
LNEPESNARASNEYVLGASEAELERLARQHAAWSAPMATWLDALGLAPGMTVVDAGCGPGAAAVDLLARIGPTGTLVGLDRSEAAIATLRHRCDALGHLNVRALVGDIEDAALAPLGLAAGGVDRILARWVLTFPPDPGRVVQSLARWLRPGGRLLVVDYDHEGVSLFPHSPGFVAVIRATRAWFESQGGDPWIAGRLPGLFRAADLELCSFEPVVQAGGPDSDVWKWAGSFFPMHAGTMVERGFLTSDEHAAFSAEWTERESDPDARFFSPIVVGAVARKR